MAKRFSDVNTMVDDLLDRLEARAEPARILAYVSDFDSIAQEDAFFADLAILERAGGVDVRRRRVDGIDVVQHIRLANAAVLYAHRRRSPAALTAEAALRELAHRVDLPAGTVEVVDEVRAAWSRNVSWGGLRPGGVQSLEECIALAMALSTRLEAEPPPTTDYRTFSRRTVGNSKTLERQRRLVAYLLRRLYPELDLDPTMDDSEVIAALGVVKFPQPLLVSGPVLIDGTALPSVPYFGLPPEHGARLSVKPVTHMLIVENYASFVRHCRELNGDAKALVVYSGGFPAQATLKAIQVLAARIAAPVFHWGDIDAGGLRIFVHLEAALRSAGVALRPHLMNLELLHARGRPPSGSTGTLKPGGATGSAIAALWDELAMAKGALSLEQEELDPAIPVDIQ